MSSLRNSAIRGGKSGAPLAKGACGALSSSAQAGWTDLGDLLAVIRYALFSEEEAGRRLSEVIHLPGPVSDRPAKSRRMRRLVIFLAMLSFSRVAMAQEEPVTTPTDLFDEAEGQGARIAPGLLLNGILEADLVHDSNIYNRPDPTVGDNLAILSPSLILRTDLARHAASLTTGAEIRRHFDETREDSEQYWLDGRARLDLGNRLAFTSRAVLAERIERRGTAGDALRTDEPVEYLEKRASFELARTGGTLELSGGVELARRDYDDATLNGNPIDQSYRDATVESVRIRANYRVSEKTQIFGQVRANRVDYDVEPGISRDSDGYGVLGGVRFAPSALTEIEAGVGFIRQSYDASNVSSKSGVNYYVRANWSPTPRLRVIANGERTFDPSPLIGVPAILRSDFDLRVQRSLGDRLLVEANAQYVQEDFEGIDRQDDRFALRFGVRARVAQHIGASAFAGYRKRSSNRSDLSYDGFTVGLGVRFLL